MDQDVVVHASTTEAGLNLAIGIAGLQATITEASWHGEGESACPRRCVPQSSLADRQFAGRRHSARPRARWTYRRRMNTALELLLDDRLDILISGETRFADPADAYPAILADADTLCHRIRY